MMQTSGVQDRIKALEHRMSQLEDTFNSDNAPIAALSGEVKDLARANGFLTRETIHSKLLFVSMDNRYGDGVVPIDVVNLMGRILRDGYQTSELLNPTCGELPPQGSDARKTIEIFNDKIISDSAGMMPAYQDTCKAMTYTCGHTNKGLINFFFGARAPPLNELDENDWTEERYNAVVRDGCFSLSRLQETDRNYWHAVCTGIEWDMFRWPFVEAFPWVGDLAQEAGNAGQARARTESRIEIMLKIAQKAKRQYEDVRSRISRGLQG